jgi:hypothetical protein
MLGSTGQSDKNDWVDQKYFFISFVLLTMPPAWRKKSKKAKAATSYPVTGEEA